MAWNENTILERAKEMARTYCDEDRISLTDVQATVQEFCYTVRAVYGSETITTVANKRVYNLARVIEVIRVRRGSTELRHGYEEKTDTYQLRPSQIVLNYNPPANQSITVEGYIVPANVSDITLQPATAWMDAIAHLVAARVLKRYGDAQAVLRAREFEQQGQNLVMELYAQLVQPYAPRPDASRWNTAYIVHRAREILRPYKLSALITDADAQSATNAFCVETRCYRTETQHTTIANQTEYDLERVVYPDEVIYDGQTLPMTAFAPHTQSWMLSNGRLRLNFEPAAGKTLIIRGAGYPQNLSELTFQPSDALMDAIAGKLAAQVLAVYNRSKDAMAAVQVLLAQYNDAVRRVQSQMNYSKLARTSKSHPAQKLSLL